MNLVFQAHETQTFPAQLTVMQCGECAGIYAINERYRQSKEEDGTGWNCPYCKCSWGYFGKTKAQKLEEQLTRERASHDQERARLRDTISRKESQRRAEKGAKTRLKKRAAVGVCPCCNRTFRQLADHMAAMHPEFVNEAKVE